MKIRSFIIPRILKQLAYSFERKRHGIDWNTNGEINAVKFLLGKKEGVLFDIGARDAEWAEDALKACPNLEIVCFEASKSNFDKIKNNQSITKYWGYVGAGDSQEIEVFEIPNGAYSTEEKVKPKASIVEITRSIIPCLNIASLINKGELPNPDFIKIDVDGSELPILRDISPILGACKCPILFEYGEFNHLAGDTFYSAFKLLTKNGYRVFRIFDDGLIWIRHYRGWLNENALNLNYLAIHESSIDAKNMDKLWLKYDL